MEIYLRGFNKEDYKQIYLWFCDTEIMSQTSANTFFASQDFMEKWIEQKIFNTKDIYLAICLKNTNEMIGYLSINDIDYKNRKALWGGLLIGNKDYWNKGLATKAAALMLKFLFDELNINLFWAFWLESNVASIKMGEKVGFKKVGILPQSIYKFGEYQNQVIMRILREEYYSK